MKFVLDMPDGLVERIYSTMGDRPGFSMRSFILLAIENQLELQLRDDEPLVDMPANSTLRDTGSTTFQGAEHWDLVEPPGSEPPSAPPVPADHRADTVDSRGHPWLWGQVNRVLPLKFVARVLAQLSLEGPIPMDEASARIGELGRLFGLQLDRLDQRQERRRDEKLSVGFPTGDSAESAVSRFRQQFFGKIRSDELISGAAFTLQLVGLLEGGLVALTEPGIRFAQLSNPVMDRRSDEFGRLSDEESHFYLEHLLDQAHGEAAAFAILLDGLHQGATTNDALNEHLASTVGDGWSESMISTQRSGAMGRMLDIGVITRLRSGRRVEFQITELGEGFLQSARQRGIG